MPFTFKQQLFTSHYGQHNNWGSARKLISALGCNYLMIYLVYSAINNNRIPKEHPPQETLGTET